MTHYILKIKDLLSVKKITQEHLADIIGKNKHTISNYFNGKTKIDIDTLQDIAQALNVPVSYFFGEDAEVKKIIGHGNEVNVNSKNNNTVTNTVQDLELCKKENEQLKERLKDKDALLKEREKVIQLLENSKK